MAVSDCFVSVVARVRDDPAIVEGFIADVIPVLRHTYSNYEVVLVDDGSREDAIERISMHLREYECIRLIRLSRRFGEEIAIAAGLDSVIGDFVVVMRPESDPPELIPKIVEKARSGAGIVFGIRHNHLHQSFLVKAGAVVFHWYCRKILKLNLPRNSTHFTVLTRQAVSAVTQIKDRNRYLPILGSHVGYGNQSFVYEPVNRNGKSTDRGFLASVKLAFDVITATSSHPLRFVTWLGTSASMLNLLYTIYVISIYLFKDHVAEGWTTVSLQTAGMFFFVFLILTVLSEYLGRVLVQSETRPLYYVLEERSSPVLFADQERRNVVHGTNDRYDRSISGD